MKLRLRVRTTSNQLARSDSFSFSSAISFYKEMDNGKGRRRRPIAGIVELS
jgi:hypothetical protein